MARFGMGLQARDAGVRSKGRFQPRGDRAGTASHDADARNALAENDKGVSYGAISTGGSLHPGDILLPRWGQPGHCPTKPAADFDRGRGCAVDTTAQFKTMQEVITLLVFVGFSICYLREPITWNYAIGFALVAAGAFFIFRGPL